MFKKISIILAVFAVAMVTQVSAEYNKYNEMDVINIYNGTLQDIADANEMSVEEFKQKMGLPEDMTADTNESIATGSIAFGKLIENSGESVEDVLTEVKAIYAGEKELTAETPYREVENNITVANYLGEADAAALIEMMGLSDVIKTDDMFGEVRNIFERRLIELSGQLPYLKEDGILVMLKGRYLNFDVAPVIINDRVMVPMRNIFEALGATVNWMGETQTIFAVRDSDIITMQVGQNSFFKNEDKIEIDSPSVIIDGRTLVPVRAVAEALDTEVFYNTNTRTVVIH